MARTLFVRKYPDALSNVDNAVYEIAEQYASIAEAEGRPRYTFFVDILDRALDAVGPDPDDEGQAALVQRATDPDYETARTYMPEVLEATFEHLRTHA